MQGAAISKSPIYENGGFKPPLLEAEDSSTLPRRISWGAHRKRLSVAKRSRAA
jgi:hypothetical protein